MTDGVLFAKNIPNGVVFYLRDSFIPYVYLNGRIIDYKIISKDTYLYLHTTKRDI